MVDDGCMGRRVIVAVRWSDSDGHADRLVGLSYRWTGSDRQFDRWSGLSYRQSDIHGRSDRWITGLMGRYVNDELTVCCMDWSYDGRMGMMDGHALSWTDSATEGQVDLQTERMTDGLVV